MRSRNRSSDGDARVEIPALLAVNANSRKDPRRESSGVDADTVGTFFDLGADRVPVDDDKTVGRLVEKKRFADPPQVPLTLLAKVDAGPDAGVDEEIIPETAGVDEAPQELGMFGRNGLPHAFDDPLIGKAREQERIEAVAFKALRPAETQPFRDQGRIAVEDTEQHLLVIPQQEDRSHSLVPVSPKPLDHLR